MDYTDLDRLIGDLERAVEDESPQKGYWREVWSLVKEVGGGFKGTRYPTRQERDDAWNHFQELVEKAKARSKQAQEHVASSQREWERRQYQSEAAKDQVQAKAAKARPLSDLERGISEIFLFPIRLVTSIILKLIGVDTPSGLEEIRQELLSCNEALQDAWKVFHERKHEMLPGDRNQAYESLQEARNRLNEAWQKWKGTKATIRERRQLEWQERQRDREARREERERKHRLFVARVEENIAKLEGKLEKATSALDKQERHLEHLREQYYSAWSEKFKDRCSEWIDESETRIESIKESIDRLERWILEERSKLD